MSGLKVPTATQLLIFISLLLTGLSAEAQRIYEGSYDDAPEYEDVILQETGWNDWGGGPGNGYDSGYGYDHRYNPNYDPGPGPGVRRYPPGGAFPGRGPRPPGYGYGYQQGPCQGPQYELRLAQTGLAIAIDNLNHIGDRCNGNALCIVGYQNVYNTAVQNVQRAQQKVNACGAGGGSGGRRRGF